MREDNDNDKVVKLVLVKMTKLMLKIIQKFN